MTSTQNRHAAEFLHRASASVGQNFNSGEVGVSAYPSPPKTTFFLVDILPFLEDFSRRHFPNYYQNLMSEKILIDKFSGVICIEYPTKEYAIEIIQNDPSINTQLTYEIISISPLKMAETILDSTDREYLVFIPTDEALKKFNCAIYINQYHNQKKPSVYFNAEGIEVKTETYGDLIKASHYCDSTNLVKDCLSMSSSNYSIQLGKPMTPDEEEYQTSINHIIQVLYGK